ncbi:MAG: response regulator [Chloroflexi bacterium]|nr:response regulator [Chloroflexota bacterium]
MADVKQILVVDDHFEMLEFLRSMLEVSNQDYEVLAVPSAEEGLFELQRSQFDLIITDVRLPGMSGFDLVRRVQTLDHGTPIIMITAYSSTQGQKEADSLGVYRYFKKPLDTDDMLTAVHAALHGESVELVVESKLDANSTIAITGNIEKRLETLRADTGAMCLTLTTVAGDVVFTGGRTHRLDIPSLAEIVARNIRDSYLLAETMGSKSPFTLQYHAGESIELYCANVGRQYFLTMFFETASRRGRIGTIWVFTQRAIKELVTLLQVDKGIGSGDSVTKESKGDTVQSFLNDTFDSMLETAVEQVPSTDEKPSMIAKSPIQEPVPEIVEEPPAPRIELEPLAVDDDELLALLGDPKVKSDESVDLDAFWDDAAEQDNEDLVRGLTLEEAQKQGLFPTDNETDGKKES